MKRFQGEVKILHLIEGAKMAEGLTVIIDVFRAFSVEAYLFAHGADKIFPVADIELAYRYKCLGVYVEIMRMYYDLQDYTNVQRYAALALNIDKASVDAYYWMIRAMRQRDSLSMAKGELKMAEHILTDEEYAELLQKLEKTKDLVI